MEIIFSPFTDTYKLLMGCTKTRKICVGFMAELMYLKVARIVKNLQNSEIREVLIQMLVFIWQNNSYL